MRGFRVVKQDCHVVACDQPLLYYVGQVVTSKPLDAKHVMTR